MKEAWGPYADEMERNFRPVQQKEIPPGLSKDELLEKYWGVHQYPQDDYDEHMGEKEYKEFEKYWGKYKKEPETEEVSILPLPELKPWTGREKQDWTETGKWLADQEKRYGPAGILKQNGGYGPFSFGGKKKRKSKRGKSKRGKSKRGKSKSRSKSRSKSKSKRKRR